MADKSPAGYLPETSQEAIDLNRAQQEALARLNEALDVRKNRVFDPRWAAAAQGFFAPTRTGHWSEALGNVIGNVSKADEAMALEEQNIAQRKLDVANQNMLMERQRQLDKMYDETSTAPQGVLSSASIKPPEGGGPTGPLIAYGAPKSPDGALPAGPSSGPMEPAPSQVQGAPADSFGIRIAPPSVGRITRDKFLADKRARGVPYSDALTQWEDIERKREEFKDVGMYRDGVFYPAATATLAEVRNIPLPEGGYGTFKTDSTTASMLADARRVGDANKELALIKRILASPIPGGKRPLSIEEENRIRQKEEDERAIRLEGGKSEAGELGKTEAGRKSIIIDSAISSGEILRPLKVLKTIAANPNAEKFLGIFARGDVFSSLAGLVESGIGIPGYSIGIPEIRKALTTTNLTTDEIRDYQTALQILTNFQLQMSKYAKGSVSNFEQNLFKASTLNIEDTPKTLLYKINLAELGAQFQRDQAALYKSMKKPNTEDFYLSRSYRKLEERYNGLMDAVLAGQGFEIPSGKSQPQPGSKGGKKPSHDELSSALDQLIGGR